MDIRGRHYIYEHIRITRPPARSGLGLPLLYESMTRASSLLTLCYKVISGHYFETVTQYMNAVRHPHKPILPRPLPASCRYSTWESRGEGRKRKSLVQSNRKYHPFIFHPSSQYTHTQKGEQLLSMLLLYKHKANNIKTNATATNNLRFHFPSLNESGERCGEQEQEMKCRGM